MKRVFAIIGDILLYFLIALGLGFLTNHTVGMNMTTLEFAIGLTVGWVIWQILKFLIEKLKRKGKGEEKNSNI